MSAAAVFMCSFLLLPIWLPLDVALLPCCARLITAVSAFLVVARRGARCAWTSLYLELHTNVRRLGALRSCFLGGVEQGSGGGLQIGSA